VASYSVNKGGRLGRNRLAHAAGDAANAVLVAAECKFCRLLACPAIILRVWIVMLIDCGCSQNQAALA
jgi:hypothetical protein